MFDLLWDSKETEEVKRSVKLQCEERSLHPWAPKPMWIKEGNWWVKKE
jgi:hypothetical protein